MVVDRALVSGIFDLGPDQRAGKFRRVSIHRTGPSPVAADLEAYVGRRLARSSVEDMMRLSGFLHRARLAFATKVRCKNGETDLTFASFLEYGMTGYFDAGNPNLNSDVFFVRRDGRLIGREEFMHLPLESRVFETAVGKGEALRSKGDPFCSPSILRYITSTAFQDAFHRHDQTYPSVAQGVRKPSPDVAAVVSGAAVFSLACAPFLDQEVLKIMRANRRFLYSG